MEMRGIFSVNKDWKDKGKVILYKMNKSNIEEHRKIALKFVEELA